MVALNVGDHDRTAPLEQVAIEKGVVFRDADVGRVFRLFSDMCAGCGATDPKQCGGTQSNRKDRAHARY